MRVDVAIFAEPGDVVDSVINRALSCAHLYDRAEFTHNGATINVTRNDTFESCLKMWNSTRALIRENADKEALPPGVPIEVTRTPLGLLESRIWFLEKSFVQLTERVKELGARA